MQECYDVVSDMPEQQRERAAGLVAAALGRPGGMASDYAEEIKCALDREWGPAWHVVVGRSFGSDVTHEAYSYLNCSCGPWSVVAFKAGYL